MDLILTRGEGAHNLADVVHGRPPTFRVRPSVCASRSGKRTLRLTSPRLVSKHMYFSQVVNPVRGVSLVQPSHKVVITL